jgi:hypothetical protein
MKRDREQGCHDGLLGASSCLEAMKLGGASTFQNPSACRPATLSL